MNNKYFQLHLGFEISNEISDVIWSKMVKIDGRWKCLDCNYTISHKWRMFEHIDSVHCDFTYVCPVCQNVCNSYQSMKKHRSKYHREQWMKQSI